MFTKEIKNNEVSANGGAGEVSIFAFLYILAHKKQKWTGSLIIIRSLHTIPWKKKRIHKKLTVGFYGTETVIRIHSIRVYPHTEKNRQMCQETETDVS
jgi:hypothetical protein